MAVKKEKKGNPYLVRARHQENTKFVELCKAETKRRKQAPEMSPDFIHATVVEEYLDRGEDIDIQRKHPLLMIIKPQKKS